MDHARDLHKKWGHGVRVGLSHLLSEHGDLLFLLLFFETVLGREHSGKLPLATFNSVD